MRHSGAVAGTKKCGRAKLRSGLTRMRWPYIRQMHRLRGGHIISDAPKAEKPNTGVKLLHARLEMSGDREALLANLRVLLPDEGLVTVEW